MISVAFWVSVVSITVSVGLLLYVYRVLKAYKDYMDRLGHDVAKVATAIAAHMLEKGVETKLDEIKRWQSLFVRMVFQAARTVESKLDEAFWEDLRGKYPDLEIFPGVIEEKQEEEQEEKD